MHLSVELVLMKSLNFECNVLHGKPLVMKWLCFILFSCYSARVATIDMLIAFSDHEFTIWNIFKM